MKKILTLAVLMIGLIVGPAKADAASGCGYGYQPPANGLTGRGFAICQTLTPGGEGAHGGEKVRAVIFCQNTSGVFEMVNYEYVPRYSGWQWLPQTMTPWVYCPTNYPIVGYITYQLGVGP